MQSALLEGGERRAHDVVVVASSSPAHHRRFYPTEGASRTVPSHSDRRRSCTLVTVAERWFLKLDGIAGESTDVAHKGEIDIDSWSWGVSNTRLDVGGGGGGGAGKASFQDFHFVSRISKASPALFLACASGSHIKEALLSGVRGSGKARAPTSSSTSSAT